MPVSDNLVDIIVHLVVGLLGNKADEHKELLVVLLNPDVVTDGDKPDQHLQAIEAASTSLKVLHLYPIATLLTKL